MGKGLIPADLETWKPRRRAIVPAFHRAYLEAMVAMFGHCTQETVRKLERAADHPQVSMHHHGSRHMEKMTSDCLGCPTQLRLRVPWLHQLMM